MVGLAVRIPRPPCVYCDFGRYPDSSAFEYGITLSGLGPGDGTEKVYIREALSKAAAVQAPAATGTPHNMMPAAAAAAAVVPGGFI